MKDESVEKENGEIRMGIQGTGEWGRFRRKNELQKEIKTAWIKIQSGGSRNIIIYTFSCRFN